MKIDRAIYYPKGNFLEGLPGPDLIYIYFGKTPEKVWILIEDLKAEMLLCYPKQFYCMPESYTPYLLNGKGASSFMIGNPDNFFDPRGAIVLVQADQYDTEAIVKVVVWNNSTYTIEDFMENYAQKLNYQGIEELVMH